MNVLHFSDTVSYNNESLVNCFCNVVEDYFCLGNQKAFVLQNRAKDGREKVVFSTIQSSSVVKVIKVASYFTGVIPLFFLAAKICIRSKHRFKVVDMQSKKEKEIDINASIPILKSFLPQILRREQGSGFTVLTSSAGNFIFTLKQVPNLVFKMASPYCSVPCDGGWLNSKERIEHRFTKMITAQQVCLVNRLGQLVIPQAKKFNVEVDGATYTLIAERKLDFNSKERAQQELYYKHSTELQETTRQLAVFIAKTGFNDVTWRNIPIMNESQGFVGPRRVALIDLEHMESVVSGFIGDRRNGSCGLLGCVSVERMDVVIKEAQKQGVVLPKEDITRLRENGKQQLELRERLRQFHEKKNIVTGKEPVQVDFHSLGLNLEATVDIKVRELSNGERHWITKTVTIQKVVEDVIDAVNKGIQNSSDQDSIQEKRYIVLKTGEGNLSDYAMVCFPGGDKSVLTHVLETLENKGIFFKTENEISGYYCSVQA